MITKDKLMAGADTRPPVEIEVPQWGDTALLRHPTFKEWHAIMKETTTSDGTPSADLIARTIAVCLCDENGKRLLTDFEAQKLLDKDTEAVLYLYKKCQAEVLSAEGKVEEAEKN